ncbi:MAG: N-acetyl-gamma-glutamyl-phosphate reductase [Acidimicrobiales bacterium]|nr:MAG: N-acetyl-gamma-glutamyl-phosphate reductase [Acidimicrobiales bacterium]
MYRLDPVRVGLVGASGFVGGELLRLLAHHPHLHVETVAGAGSASRSVAELHPWLAADYPSLTISPVDPEKLTGLDVVFCATPHGDAAELVASLVGRVGLIVDCSADFRLPDPEQYRRWYGTEHPHPELLSSARYGLVELSRDALKGAKLVAVPGCYPTAAGLVLAPLIEAGLCEPDAIVDAASGVSGAGRKPSEGLSFWAVDEDFRAYGLLDHRHTPEMEMVTGARILFTPHLAPMTRGILVTCYAKAARRMRREEPYEVLAERYRGEPFVLVTGERLPSTKATRGSNSVHMTAFADERTGTVVALAALDNLVKGAAGQAIQCANVALGIEETAGLVAGGLGP